MNNLVINYDKLFVSLLDKRENKNQYENFWGKVFSNHKITKDFVAEENN